MKKHLWIILPSLTGTFMVLQMLEIGTLSGGRIFIEDTGASNYISSNNRVFGIQYRYNLNPRYSIRLNLKRAGISDIELKTQRNTEKTTHNPFKNISEKPQTYLISTSLISTTHKKKEHTLYICRDRFGRLSTQDFSAQVSQINEC
ncbi:MAG: DUF6089 family protein [Flavobacteriales bacterium Tduv]